MRWILAVALAGVFFGGEAVAQLSEVDLVAGSGDAKVTLDAATGLYWLDVPEVTNVSVTDILAGADGWIGSGWRYATPSEICGLFASYALAVLSCGGASPASTSGDVVGTLQSFLGLTVDNEISRSTIGLYDDGGDPTRVGVARIVYSISPDTSSSLVQNSGTQNLAIANVGHWLVRDTPIPPPVPGLTFGPWMLGALGFCLALGSRALVARGPCLS